MPLKPTATLGGDTFFQWREAYNTLLGVAVGYVVSASAPTINDDVTNYENLTLWLHTTPNPNEAYILIDNTDGAAVWLKLGSVTGTLLADGTVPLTANWNAGSFNITAQQLISTQTTGTAPLTVASTTVVTNLNADTVDGSHASALLARANHTGTQLMSTISDAGSLATLSTVDTAQLTNNAVDNTKASDMASWTIKMRNTGTTGDPVDAKISGLTEVTSIASNDHLLVELSTGELRRILGSNAGGADNSVTNAKLADMSAWTIKMRSAAGTGDPSDTKISALTETVTVAGTDHFLVELSTGELRRVLASNKVAVDSVSNTKLADMAAWTLKLRNAGTTGDPSDTKISALTESTTVASTDWLILELSTGELRKLSAGKVGGLTNDQTVKLASFNAVAGNRYFIDTDTGAGSASDVIVTLPTSPAFGDTVEIFHVGVGDCATPAANEALYVNPGASWKIMQGANDEDLRIDKNNAAVRLIYTNGTYGWRVAIL